MNRALRILIVGGYGMFGGRIVRLLEEEARLTLLVAGRSLEKAAAFCAMRGATGAVLIPSQFDRDGDVRAQLHTLRPDVVIDASGPFQAYGENRYRLIEACIAEKISYLDLADGVEFVAGVAALDDSARAAGVFALSGVSSFPVLSAAALRALSRDMEEVDSVHGGIAPSPHAGVGENVLKAIAGYAGQPVPLLRDGREAIGYPFTESLWFTIAPPGRVPLERKLFSLAEVPDLRVLAEVRPEAKTVWIGGGPVPRVLHLALKGFAWLVRLKLLRSLLPLVPVMGFVMHHVRWGEDRGGMFIEAKGRTASGTKVAQSWHLVAEGDDGPLIPAMAVAAILFRMLDGIAPEPGARAAIRALELEDYAPLFARRRIVTGFRTTPPDTAPLYARLLGEAFTRLPAAIRAMHDVTGEMRARGRAEVKRGKGPIANIVATLFGFPKAAADVEVEVRFTPIARGEKWTRRFGANIFSSRQTEGRDRYERLVVESFGPLNFAMAIVTEDNQLKLVLRHWDILGLPLPMELCPRSDSFESEEDGRFRFTSISACP
jgi:hypothetical protein